MEHPQGKKMKRTRQINLQRMRKSPRRFLLKPLTAAIAGVILSSCSDSPREAKVYANEEECINNQPELVDECKAAYQDALDKAAQTAPKYNRRYDCEAEFGRNACVPHQSSTGSSWFMPAMAGYMFARALDRPNYYYREPMFTSYSSGSRYRDRWITADGRNYGSRFRSTVRADNSTFKPKPKVTRTISRGGFGSKVAAKSSWGGSRSRGGWGG